MATSTASDLLNESDNNTHDNLIFKTFSWKNFSQKRLCDFFEKHLKEIFIVKT